MKKIMTSLTLFLLLGSVPAIAQDVSSNSTVTGSNSLDFTTLDSDRNGFLNMEEFNASGMSGAGMFEQVDTNSDGSLSMAEVTTWNGSNANSTTPSSGTGMSGATDNISTDQSDTDQFDPEESGQ